MASTIADIPASARPSLCAIIHTCDKYEFCWDGARYYLQKYWRATEVPIYFCNESKALDWPGFGQILTGSGDWADRLMTILNSVDTDYVFYMQEDMWPQREMTSSIIARAFELIQRWGFLSLHVDNGSGAYKLTPVEDDVYRFDPDSPYLVSHQPAIWYRKFLRSCLRPGEGPKTNELMGTKRLQQLGVTNKVGMLIYDWYAHVCRGGRLTDLGRELEQKARE